jgi:recombination protein RecA
MVKKKEEEKKEKKEESSKEEKEKEEELSEEEKREKLREQTRKEINKEFGKGTTSTADKLIVDIPRISTGVFALDRALGGGIPVGRMTMATGVKSSAKTTLMLKIVANAQKMCSNCWGWPECTCGNFRKTLCAWLDQEGVLDNIWARRMNVDLSELELQRPITAEETIDVVNKWMRSGVMDLYVIDSIAAMTPMKEMEESTEKKWQQGLQAKLVNRAMRTWTSSLNQNLKLFGRIPTILLINQIRYKIGVSFGDPKTKPGGEGQKFATSAELDLWSYKPEIDKESGLPLDKKFGFDCSKNKTAPAHSKGEFVMVLQPAGLKKVGDIIEEDFVYKEAEKFGLIVQEGKKKFLFDGDVYQSKGSVVKTLLNDRAKFERLKIELMDLMLKPWKQE